MTAPVLRRPALFYFYYLALRQTQGSIRTEAPDWQPWLAFVLRAVQPQKQRLAGKVERERLILSYLPELSVQILEQARAHKLCHNPTASALYVAIKFRPIKAESPAAHWPDAWHVPGSILYFVPPSISHSFVACSAKVPAWCSMLLTGAKPSPHLCPYAR